jgi:MFS family permease
MRLRTFEPLAIRDFALLWTGMTFSLFGDFFFTVALAWETYNLSNSTKAYGVISAAYLAPTVLFLVFGGVLTDRIERRRMMIAADVLRAAAIGVAGVLAVTGHLTLWQLGIAVALTGVGDALFRPAFGSIVPEIVPKSLLAQANSLDQFVRTGTLIVGPVMAGVVIAVADAGVALLIDAGTFLVSTVTALMLTPRPMARTEKGSFIREAREGFGFVRARPWLWASLVASALMNVAIAARTVLLPYLVKNDLHKSALGLGLVSAATGAGALLCALVIGQRGLPHRHVLAMYFGWTVFLIAITAYGLGTSIAELVCFAFVGGAGIALGNAIWGTMMHRLVPRELLGRVTSIDLFFAFSLMPLYTVIVGFVAAAVGVRVTLVAAGASGALLAVIFLFATPGIRDSEHDGSMALPAAMPDSL